MGLDLNKIINESVSGIKDQTTDTDNTDIETLTEGTDVTTENTDTDIDTQTTNVDAEANVNSACLASAISAGLGAMTFRNKLSRLQEGLSETAKQRLKTGAKVGAGLAAAGAAGAGLYRAAKGEDGKLSVDNLKDTGKKLVGGVKNLVKRGEESPTDGGRAGTPSA